MAVRPFLFSLLLEDLHQLEEVIGAAVSLRPIIADIDLLIRRPERRKVMDYISFLYSSTRRDQGRHISNHQSAA